jgi:hypothetical protein
MIRFREGYFHIRAAENCTSFQAVLRIRIRMFLGLPDTYPDPLATSTDPDHSIIKQN